MPGEFIKELREREISISFHKGKLQYSGPEQNIDEQLITNLKKNKTKLLKHFWPKECPNMLPLNTDGSLSPFILLHGGSFFQLSEYLGNERPLYSFYYIGSETEEPKAKYKNIEAFASEYLRQLQYILPNGPYLLGGMSMGGHLAFEMAIQLQNQGFEVPMVVMVDSGLPLYETKNYHRKLYKRVYNGLYELLRKTKKWYMTAQKKIKYTLFPSSFRKLSISQRTAHIVQIYDEMINKYQPLTEYKGKMLLFRASENPFHSEYLGWDKVCKNIVAITYKGNHSDMFRNLDAIELIKNNISDWLDKIEKSQLTMNS